MKKLSHVVILFAAAFLFSCKSHKESSTEEQSDSSFNMVFMTDIHIQPELNAVEGFRKALDTINKLKPEFVVTGGDLIMDALGQKQSRADSLYTLYNEEVKRLNMPLHNTIGNHELFGVYAQSGVDTSDALYANKMFQKRIGNSFYAFTHKNWKFFVLDDIIATKDRQYLGHIPDEEIAWIKKELMNTSNKTPLAIVLHIPLLTSFAQFSKGALEPNTPGLVVNNSKEILDLFASHNLKLVLQGHLHILEDNYIKNVHFITGGAICGAWWEGPHEGTEEGFLYMSFNGDKFNWKYIDYGWDPAAKK